MSKKTLITLFCAVLLSGAIISQAQAYHFGTGINTNFGSGINTKFGTGVNSTFGSGLNSNNASTFGSGLNTNFGTSYGQGLNANQAPASAPKTPPRSTATTNNTTQPQQNPQPTRNHYYFIPWGWGGNTYKEDTTATKASETSTSKSNSSGSASVEASSSNLYKISVDLGQFNNNADNVKMSVNNHTIKVYGGSYSQTFKIEKKIVKNGIRNEVSGNTLIIYVPLKD